MEYHDPLSDRAISRRQLLAVTAAGLGTAAIGRGSPAAASEVGHLARVPASTDVPWTDYFGAAQDKPVWSSVQRGGRFVNRFGQLKVTALRNHLQSHELLSWGAPHESLRTFEGIDNFMRNVRESGGAWWRDKTRAWVNSLIYAHANSPHKVVALSTGNEVNAMGLRDNLAFWAASAGLPFPHPRSNYGDGSRSHSRDHIGYYVEYLLAPAVEGARLANSTAAVDDRVPIMAGTMVGARHPHMREQFLPALLDYEIGGEFAPTLAGRPVRDVVDYLGIHYLLTPEKIFGYAAADGSPLPYGYRQALSDLHARWVGNGAIRGIWETEEGGNATHKVDRHASIALRVFARSMSWAIDNAITPDQFRLFGSYKGPPGGWLEYQPREETSWGFAMGILHDFLGHSSRLINRSAGATAVVDDPTENYAFETDDGRRRVVIVTPQSANWQGPTTVIAAGMAADGWTEPAVVANGHLFKSDAEGYATFPVAVVRNDATNRYELTLPSPIALNSNLDMQVLLITINRA